MTDCDNALVRDLLPDLANGRLTADEVTRVREHLAGCTACADEFEVIRAIRAVRPVAAPVNVAAIVAALPRPVAAQAAPAAESSTATVVSLDARRIAKRQAFAGGGWRARNTWQNTWKIAAAIGFMIVGGWSVVLLQPDGLHMLTGGTSDSVRLADAAERAAADSQLGASPTLAIATEDPSREDAGAAVSFGDVGGYTDEELQRVLDRLEQWDGATSTESMTTAPILPIPAGGSPDDN